MFLRRWKQKLKMMFQKQCVFLQSARRLIEIKLVKGLPIATSACLHQGITGLKICGDIIHETVSRKGNEALILHHPTRRPCQDRLCLPLLRAAPKIIADQ